MKGGTKLHDNSSVYDADNVDRLRYARSSEPILPPALEPALSRIPEAEPIYTEPNGDLLIPGLEYKYATENSTGQLTRYKGTYVGPRSRNILNFTNVTLYEDTDSETPENGDAVGVTPTNGDAYGEQAIYNIFNRPKRFFKYTDTNSNLLVKGQKYIFVDYYSPTQKMVGTFDSVKDPKSNELQFNDILPVPNKRNLRPTARSFMIYSKNMRPELVPKLVKSGGANRCKTRKRKLKSRRSHQKKSKKRRAL